MISKILQNLQVRDVMTSKVIVVQDTNDFSLVTEKMDTYGIRHLPIVDSLGKLVGIITQRHLYKLHSPRKLEDGSWYYDKDALNGFILSKVMIRQVKTLAPEATLFQAVSLMVDNKIGCIVIVDHNQIPVGILTRDDVFKLLFTQ